MIRQYTELLSLKILLGVQASFEIHSIETLGALRTRLDCKTHTLAPLRLLRTSGLIALSPTTSKRTITPTRIRSDGRGSDGRGDSERRVQMYTQAADPACRSQGRSPKRERATQTASHGSLHPQNFRPVRVQPQPILLHPFQYGPQAALKGQDGITCSW